MSPVLLGLALSPHCRPRPSLVVASPHTTNHVATFSLYRPLESCVSIEWKSITCRLPATRFELRVSSPPCLSRLGLLLLFSLGVADLRLRATPRSHDRSSSVDCLECKVIDDPAFRISRLEPFASGERERNRSLPLFARSRGRDGVRSRDKRFFNPITPRCSDSAALRSKVIVFRRLEELPRTGKGESCDPRSRVPALLHSARRVRCEPALERTSARESRNGAESAARRLQLGLRREEDAEQQATSRRSSSFR